MVTNCARGYEKKIYARAKYFFYFWFFISQAKKTENIFNLLNLMKQNLDDQ